MPDFLHVVSLIVSLGVDSLGEMRPRIGIITALPHEFAAMKSMFDHVRGVDVAGRGPGGRGDFSGRLATPLGDPDPRAQALSETGLAATFKQVRSRK
jgi:hypothetical protein